MCFIIGYLQMEELDMGVSDFFFYKQKTAYEMRISDWSSDVCSSDRGGVGERDPRHFQVAATPALEQEPAVVEVQARIGGLGADAPEHEIGRATCRDRVCQIV